MHMSTEAMKLALEAIQDLRGYRPDIDKAIDAIRTAIQQAEAQQPATTEPVYWEWRHLSTHPDTVDFGKWSEWKRVEARNAIHTIEDALAEFRAYIAQGYKYELRALYTHPSPSAPADVVRDAERYRFIRDADVSDDLIPDIALYAMESLDEYIDAAMLAAK